MTALLDSSRLVRANAIFYPAAALYAALALPASVFAMTGMLQGVPGLSTGFAHAHEMLFGFALAVVAGNQVGSLAVRRMALLFVLWLTARGAFVFAPTGVLSALANSAFALALALQLLPKRVRAVKRVRNFALPASLAALCVAVFTFELAPAVGLAWLQRTALEVGVLFFALLLLFMGGRIIAPAVAGEFHRQGERLNARVQPNVEAGLLVALLIAIAAAPITVAKPVTALGCGIAGVLAGVRLLRWRLWACIARPDLLCLAAGYAWLAAGLLLFGAAWATDFHATTALHIITVGALGTLTLNVMAFSWLLKAGVDSARERLPVYGTLLLAAAVVARVIADFVDAEVRNIWLVSAALGWGFAFLLLFALFRKHKLS